MLYAPYEPIRRAASRPDTPRGRLYLRYIPVFLRYSRLSTPSGGFPLLAVAYLTRLPGVVLHRIKQHGLSCAFFIEIAIEIGMPDDPAGLLQ